jgi:hypothetical protein
MLLDFRKPKCIILKEGKSWSGKYKFFLGQHYVKGKLCFDVGAINQVTGEITSRHYNETSDYAITSAKAEALRIYDGLAKRMKEKPKSEEQEDNNPFVADEYRRQLKKGLS